MAAVVDHDQIAKRAYELYETRGKQPGNDLHDWLQAEKEIVHTNNNHHMVVPQSIKKVAEKKTVKRRNTKSR